MITQLIKDGENQYSVIDVKEYPIKPIAYKNRYYKRIENSNHLMNLDEIANMHLQTINASDDLTIQKLQSGNYSSKTRNRAIARAFKEAGIIERYGSGIARIKNECKNHGVAEPTFEEFVHGFRVIIFKEKIETTQETTQETKKLLTKDKILLELKKDATLTREELAKKIGVSANAIKQHLSKLKDEKKIQRVGSTKSGHWEVLLDS